VDSGRRALSGSPRLRQVPEEQRLLRRRGDAGPVVDFSSIMIGRYPEAAAASRRPHGDRETNFLRSGGVKTPLARGPYRGWPVEARRAACARPVPSPAAAGSTLRLPSRSAARWFGGVGAPGPAARDVRREDHPLVDEAVHRFIDTVMALRFPPS